MTHLFAGGMDWSPTMRKRSRATMDVRAACGLMLDLREGLALCAGGAQWQRELEPDNVNAEPRCHAHALHTAARI